MLPRMILVFGLVVHEGTDRVVAGLTKDVDLEGDEPANYEVVELLLMEINKILKGHRNISKSGVED